MEATEQLRALSDRELARVINGGDGGGSNWSHPENCARFLARFEVQEVGKGLRHNRTDGECDLIFVHWPSRQNFRLNDNYYNFECFVPVARWAIERAPEGGGEG